MFEEATRLRFLSCLLMALLGGCQLPGQVVGGRTDPSLDTSCSVGSLAPGEAMAAAPTRALYRPLVEGEPPEAEHLSIHLSTAEASASNDVHVPASGHYEIELTNGPQFAVIDGDASDGRATVAVPPHAYDLFVRSNGCRNATIDFADDAYLVAGMLDADAQRTLWFHLGIRVLPIDSKWGLGGAYHYRFTSAGRVDTELRLYRSEGDAELPQGMAWLDERGGNVALPGIATLSVPAGALFSRQLVRLTQRSETPELGPGFRPATSIVAIEPQGLQFNQPASLDLAADPTIEPRGNSPLYYLTSETRSDWEFVPLSYETLLPPSEELSANRLAQVSIPHGIPVFKSAYYFAFKLLLGYMPLYEDETEHYVLYVDEQVRRNEALPSERARVQEMLQYVKYTLEKSYERYQEMQEDGAVSPQGYPYRDRMGQLHYKSPVFIESGSEVQAETNPMYGLHLKFSYIRLMSFWDVTGHTRMISSIAHEVFHQFQYACMGRGLFDGDLINKLRTGGKSKWFIEGPARYMGLAMLFEAKAERFQNDPKVPIPPMLDTLMDIRDEFDANWLLMGQPLTNREEQAKQQGSGNGEYQTSVLFAAIANKLGYPVLLEIAKQFQLALTPESAIDKALQPSGYDLTSAYHDAALIALRPERYFQFPSYPYAPLNYRYKYPSNPDPRRQKTLRSEEEVLSDSLVPLSAHYYVLRPFAGDRVRFELALQPHQRVRLVGPKDSPTEFVSNGESLKVDPLAEYQLIVSSGQPQSMLSSGGSYDVKLITSRTPPAISSASATYVLDQADPRYYRAVNVTWTSAHAYEDTYSVGVSQWGAGDGTDTPVLQGSTTQTGRQHQLIIPVGGDGRANMALGKVFISASSGASATGSVR